MKDKNDDERKADSPVSAADFKDLRKPEERCAECGRSVWDCACPPEPEPKKE